MADPSAMPPRPIPHAAQRQLQSVDGACARFVCQAPCHFSSRHHHHHRHHYLVDLPISSLTGRCVLAFVSSVAISRRVKSASPGELDTPYKVIQDYTAADPGELTLQVGDTVMVTGTNSETDGMLAGKLRGQFGFFPAECVEPAEPNFTFQPKGLRARGRGRGAPPPRAPLPANGAPPTAALPPAINPRPPASLPVSTAAATPPPPLSPLSGADQGSDAWWCYGRYTSDARHTADTWWAADARRASDPRRSSDTRRCTTDTRWLDASAELRHHRGVGCFGSRR